MLPLPPSNNNYPKCDVCGTSNNLEGTVALLVETESGEGPHYIEWRCENCDKAVKDARENMLDKLKYKG